MQNGSNGVGIADPSLGAGLSGIAFFSSSVPFINLFQQVGGNGDFDGAWQITVNNGNGNTTQIDYSEAARMGLLTDEGYLASLPAGGSAFVSLLNGISPDANYGGRYVFRYEGDANFSIFGGTIVEQSDGRIVVDVADGDPVGISIQSVNSDDPLRDFVLVREEYEALHDAGAIFDPVFIDLIKDFRVLRFMDWMSTNNSTVTDFDDLASVDNAFYGIPSAQAYETEIAGTFLNNGVTQAEIDALPRGFITPIFLDPVTGLPLRDTNSNELVLTPPQSSRTNADAANLGPGLPVGVPLEIMIELANQVGADPWFNIPHFATNEFVREFAAYVRDNLDPELNVYFEYSNEVWNSSFSQWQFANEEGKRFFAERAAQGDNFGQQFGDFPVNAYYGYRATEILSIIHDEFGSQAGRINGVLSTQTVNTFVTQSVFEGAEYYLQLNEPGVALDEYVSSLGVTGYFGIAITGNAEMSNAIRDSLRNLIDISRQAFTDGQTASEFELFNRELAQWFRDGTLPQGATADLFSDGNFNLAELSGFLEGQQSIIDGFDFFGNPTRTAYDIDLVEYEGGSNIIPITIDDELRDAVRQFNRSPEIAQLQAEALEEFRAVGGTLANDFQVVEQPSFSSAFGTLAHINDSNVVYDAFVNYNATAAGTFGSVETGRSATAFLQGVTQLGTNAGENFVGTVEEDFFAGNGGNDRIETGDEDDGANGGSGADTLIGGGGDDTLIGEGGNDLLLGGTGIDDIKGGEGNDIIRLGTNNNAGNGGAGDDIIVGENGSDIIVGGDGNDLLVGNAGFDLIAGDAGSDTISGGIGADSISGGADNDLIEGGTNLDTIFGGDGNDTIRAGSGNDVLIGEDGNDRIESTGSFDTIEGGAGDDTILSFDGVDIVRGGDGNDFINAGTNHDRAFGAAGNDTVIAESGNDFLVGGSGDDIVNGKAGNDTLIGGSNDDLVIGGSGRDEIDGGIGNDTILAGSNFDTITGGAGNDILSGGSAPDTFIFADGFGVDRITDFFTDQRAAAISLSNGGDRIDLSAVSAITGFADLSSNHLSADSSGNAVISVGADRIVLEGIAVTDLSANDFLF